VSETSAGAIIGTLRLTITDFESGIAKAQALADSLDGKNVNVDVKVDSGAAETKLAAVAASEDKVDGGNKKIAQSGKDAGKGMGLLSMAIVGLGPAIVPLAAGAAGLAVGFGAMGAAGILAIVGISREMKAGTPLGGAYTAMVGTLSGDLTTLGHTAASGVLGPFQKEVATLQGQMPALNGIIGQFSVITGKTAGNLMAGLVAAFIALEPLARDVGVYVLDLSSKFAAAMSGPGVVSFGDYIRSVFPQVMQSVESIVTAAVHLVAALAPLGMGTLGMLRVFTDVINALPVDVLANLATVAYSVFMGFKAYGILSVGVTALGTALNFVGVSAETAATGLAVMNIAAGAVAAILAVAMFAFSASSESTRQATQAANDYADALIRSNGAIDANVREMAFKTLQDNGAIDAAKTLGLNLSLVTSAATGNIPATQMLAGQMQGLAGQTGLTADKTLTQNDALRTLRIGLGENATALGTGTQKQKDHAAAMLTGAADAGTLTTATLLGMSAAQQATSADKSQVAAIKTLNAAIDEEISKQLSLAGATSNVDQATLTMNATLKANNGTMSEHTQKGIDDRRAIEGVVGSLQSQRDANIKAGDSTALATSKYKTASAALLDQTGKMYGTTSQAYKYMKQLLAIPNNVTTKIDANKDPAAAKVVAIVAQINAIRQGRVPGIDANTAAGRQKIADLQWQIDHLRGRAVSIVVRTLNAVTNSVTNLPTSRPGVTPANGGILTGFAAGGIQGFPTGESHVAQIAPAGAWRLWAEPETGGEAYIPLAPSKRARSTAILNEVERAFGLSGGTDMTGVRADLAEQTSILRSLIPGFSAALDRSTRTAQTMQRQMAG